MKARYAFVFAVWLGAANIAAAQQWAVKMFPVTKHDFGTVARGAKVEYDFIFENVYEEDVHVAAVRSSCNCTTPEIVKPLAKTWEKAAIKAVIDTRAFLGRKDATITVRFDKPFEAEVQLHVYAFIRGDVVVQPGVVNLGNVVEGAGAKQKVQVSYAGRSDWQIVRVESASANLAGQVVETERSPSGVKYDLLVTLKEGAPTGYIQDHLVLVTNDYTASAARVPVPVEGIVGAGVSVRPSPLMLVVESGQTVSRQLVVHGRQPFRITAAQCADPRFKLTVPAEAKAVHLLPVAFAAGSVPGSFNTSIRIQTDVGRGQAIDVPVQVRITPLSSAAAEPAVSPQER